VSQPGSIPQCHRTNSAEVHLVLLFLLALLISVPAFGAESGKRQTAPGSRESVTVVQTSFVPRVITNVVEMRVPTNVFITVYRTNEFEVLQTDVVDVYRTNLVKTVRTNIIPVALTLTNVVTLYETNWNHLTRTNLITRYQTNVNTLTLTNWETVLVFKTNRFTQPVTNLVQVDLPATRAATFETKAKDAPKDDPATATVASTDGFLLEAARTAKLSANGQAEISLKLKSAGDKTPAFLSQEWQVGRTDNSVLLFGRGPEFKRELPLGTYKVDVKARTTEGSPLVRVRGTFEVTRDEVIVQKPSGLVNAR